MNCSEKFRRRHPPQYDLVEQARRTIETSARLLNSTMLAYKDSNCTSNIVVNGSFEMPSNIAGTIVTADNRIS